MRNYAVKLGPMYLMYGRHYTNNPEHPEIIRCTLEDALIIASAPEYVVVHPSVDESEIILKANVSDGRTNESTYAERMFIEDMAELYMSEGCGVLIRVVGENGYYTNNGFSRSAIEWKERPEGWIDFVKKDAYRTKNGELVMALNGRGKRYIRGAWEVNGMHKTKAFAYNLKAYKKARQWLHELEGMDNE